MDVCYGWLARQHILRRRSAPGFNPKGRKWVPLAPPALFGRRRALGNPVVERLQRQIAQPKPLDIVMLLLETVVVTFFGADQPLEELLGRGVGIGRAFDGLSLIHI